jgi:transcriptional pleiotropic regulator of transition state genes
LSIGVELVISTISTISKISKISKKVLIFREVIWMKSTGIVRKVDELGRIVIPKELRDTLGIEIKDPIEIFTDGDKIILSKYQANLSCIFCGNGEQVIYFKQKAICHDCVHLIEEKKEA